MSRKEWKEFSIRKENAELLFEVLQQSTLNPINEYFYCMLTVLWHLIPYNQKIEIRSGGSDNYHCTYWKVNIYCTIPPKNTHTHHWTFTIELALELAILQIIMMTPNCSTFFKILNLKDKNSCFCLYSPSACVCFSMYHNLSQADQYAAEYSAQSRRMLRQQRAKKWNSTSRVQFFDVRSPTWKPFWKHDPLSVP